MRQERVVELATCIASHLLFFLLFSDQLHDFIEHVDQIELERYQLILSRDILSLVSFQL